MYLSFQSSHFSSVHFCVSGGEFLKKTSLHDSYLSLLTAYCNNTLLHCYLMAVDKSIQQNLFTFFLCVTFIEWLFRSSSLNWSKEWFLLKGEIFHNVPF